MKILRYIFLFSIIFSIFALNHDFQSFIDSADESDFISIIAVFHDDLTISDSIESYMQTDSPFRRPEIISMLRRNSNVLYDDFTLENFDEIKCGNIKNIRSMWLNPSIEMTLRKSLLLEMIANNRFDYYIHNKPYQMLEESHESDEALWDVRWNITTIGAEAVYDSGYFGEGALVGVFDTGIRYTHSDLTNRMWTNPGEIADNGLDDDGNGYVDDFYGYDFVNDDGDPMDDNDWTWHGTHCAGTVCGDGTFDSQTGVAPAASVMAVKVLDNGGTGYPAAVEEGLEYAANMDVQIFSLSIGWEDPSTTLSNFFRDIFENLLSLGIVAAVSAGNGSGSGGHYSPPADISAPANSPSPWYGSAGHTAVIAVGATDVSDSIANFSSYGHVEWTTSPYDDYPYLIKPDIMAPGVAITSTWGYSDESYHSANGTSQAAPHIAGAAAILLSKAPYLTPRQIDSLLCYTALDLGDSGRDNYYGAGRVRIDLALNAAPAPPYPVVNYLIHSIDDSFSGDGNTIFDRGETCDVLVNIKNTGALVEGLTAIISTSDPYITITDNSAVYGDIAINEDIENTADPFTMSCDISAPLGHSFEVIMSFTGDAGAYTAHDTFEISISNYPRQHIDLAYGTGTLTITNFGSFGFFDASASSPLGSGFEYLGNNYLYSSTFLLGLTDGNVSSGANGVESEFLPIANIESSPALYGDQELFSAFVDPMSSLVINMRAISWDMPPNNDFVIVRFKIDNPTDSSITYYSGLYADMDIHYVSGEGWYDRAAYDPTERRAFMWDNHSSPELSGYVGIAPVSLMAGGSIVNNAEYVYPSGLGWTDDVIMDFLDGSITTSTTVSDSDWSIIITAGSRTIEAYESDTLVWAFVAGNTQSDFENNCLQARNMLVTVLGMNDKKLLPIKTSLQCYPNPFNASLMVHKKIDEKITISDIVGRAVYSNCSKNNYVKWQPSKKLPGGVYIIRSESECQRVLYIP